MRAAQKPLRYHPSSPLSSASDCRNGASISASSVTAAPVVVSRRSTAHAPKLASGIFKNLPGADSCSNSRSLHVGGEHHEVASCCIQHSHIANFAHRSRARILARAKIIIHNLNSNMAQQSSTPSLYPHIESLIAPLEDSPRYQETLRIEREIIESLRKINDPLEDVGDLSILPSELLSDSKKGATPKVDPLKRLKNLPNEEVEEEEEEEDEDEEDEDEEQQVEDEEVGAGDYNETHFDPGEGFEDNDEDGDEVSL